MRRLRACLVLFLFAIVVSAGALSAAADDGKPADSGMMKIVKKVAPAYPADAKTEKIQGTVVLDVTIGADGKVLDAKASKSPDERLSKAAIDAVKQWEFEPKRDDKGKAVKVKSTVTVNFRLQ
jgi:TonB family protein